MGRCLGMLSIFLNYVKIYQVFQIRTAILQFLKIESNRIQSYMTDIKFLMDLISKLIKFFEFVPRRRFEFGLLP